MTEIQEIVYIIENGLTKGKTKECIAEDILDMILARRGINQC